MAVALSPLPKFVAYDNNGAPLAGGKLYTYIASSTTPLATFTDATGATANPNPTILDSAGRADVWLTIGSAYRLELRDSTDAVTYWTIDQVIAVPQGNPALIDDASATVEQSEATMDPGEVGAEVLAVNLAQELQQLRFRIKEITGAASWRTTYGLRRVQGTVLSGEPLGAFEPNVDTGMVVELAYDFCEGILGGSVVTYKMLRRTLSAVGTVKMSLELRRHRGGAPDVSLATTAIDFAPGGTNSVLFTYAFGITDFQAGDVISLAFIRQGTLPADTNEDRCYMLGHWFEYTGILGR